MVGGDITTIGSVPLITRIEAVLGGVEELDPDSRESRWLNHRWFLYSDRVEKDLGGHMPRPDGNSQKLAGFVNAQLRKDGDSVEGIFRARTLNGSDYVYFVETDDGQLHKLPGYKSLASKLWELAAAAKAQRISKWLRVELVHYDGMESVFDAEAWDYQSGAKSASGTSRKTKV